MGNNATKYKGTTPHVQYNILAMNSKGFYPPRSKQPLQEIMIHLIGENNKKDSPCGLLAPSSNLTKMSFWTSQFQCIRFD
jgi:hypothetical protein